MLYDESITVVLGALNQIFILLQFRVVLSDLTYFRGKLILQLPEIDLSFS